MLRAFIKDWPILEIVVHEDAALSNFRFTNEELREIECILKYLEPFEDGIAYLESEDASLGRMFLSGSILNIVLMKFRISLCDKVSRRSFSLSGRRTISKSCVLIFLIRA